MIIGVLIAIGIAVFVLYLMYSALNAVPAEHRKMEPSHVWLLLIPLFNLVWIFFVVTRISESYQSLFYSRGRTDIGDAGRGVGLAYAICSVCSIIPCLGLFAALGGLICLILFLVKISGLKSQIPQLAQFGNVPGAFPVGYAGTPGMVPPPPYAGQQFPPPPPPPPQG
jgi:hypothetical protein